MSLINKNKTEPVSFLVSLLYQSVLLFIEHYDVALDNAIAIELNTKQGYWQHTDTPDGQKSQNLQKLAQLIDKNGLSNHYKSKSNLRICQPENRELSENSQLQTNFTGSYRKSEDRSNTSLTKKAWMADSTSRRTFDVSTVLQLLVRQDFWFPS